MEQKINYFELVSSQRYFHLIAVKPENKFSAEDYWRDCGLIQQTSNQANHDQELFNISQKRIITNISFYNGDKDFSLNGNGEAPFSYDLFTITLIGGEIILGFPFKLLAKTILDNLIERHSFLKKVSFIKPDLNKLIKLDKENISYGQEFNCYFSSVDLVLNGDTNISSVGLDGDRPLESGLYKTFFRDRVQKDECLLDKCTVKCELVNVLPKTKSSIHMDVFGNYKLYIHGSGKNIFTIPYLFKTLNDTGCLNTTLINPLTRLKDE